MGRGEREKERERVKAEASRPEREKANEVQFARVNERANLFSL